ncbi:MAG TPA: type I DNA topoisomerase [Candidatus Glassbacteria bacterium]|nr:type I DNA topoisomerase [Candidatus Glassbacteria bacterium]
MATSKTNKGQKVLIIVESPAKIKSIIKFLPKDGNKYQVLPTVGHVAELSKKGKYNLGIDLEKKYKPSFIISDNRIDVMKALVDGAREADKILVATDDDREGEHIGASVIQRLNTTGKIVKRIKFQEITKTAFSASLNKEGEIDEKLVQAAISRRVLDRMVGFLVSPLVIKRLGKGLSAGRVQSVALRLVVEREKEIEAFTPEEYWVIHSHLLTSSSDIPIIAKLVDKITNKKDALDIKKELEKSSYKVIKIVANETKRYPPKPIITSDLQKLGSSRYSFAAKRTMKAAQTLYENGKITYLRTDSVRQSEEAVDAIRAFLKKDHPKALPAKPNIYKNKDAAQDAHEAIRPTYLDSLPVDKPTTDEEKLYKIIWEVTVASQMKPALFDSTSVTIVTDKKKELKANGRVLKELGWLAVTKHVNVEKEDTKDSKLPILKKNEALNLTKPNVTAEQKFTKPPSRFSDATLVQELKDKGIGRPSTYADIMGKISDRQYVVRKGKTLAATDTGKKLVEFLKKYFDFMEYDYTADMETQLDKIGSGKQTYIRMMDKFYPSLKKMVDDAYHDTESAEFKFACDKCGKPMYIRKSNFGFFLGCSGYNPKSDDCCKNIIPCEMIDGKITPLDKKNNSAPDNVKCPKCKGPMIISNGKYGKVYRCDESGCNGYRKIPYGKKCPRCKGELYRTVFTKPPHKGPVLCCMEYPKCKYVENLNEDGFDKDRKKQYDTYKKMKKNVEDYRKNAFSPEEE